MLSLLNRIKVRLYIRALEKCTLSLPSEFFNKNERVRKNSREFAVYTNLLRTYIELGRRIRSTSESFKKDLQQARLRRLLSAAKNSSWWRTYLASHDLDPSTSDWFNYYLTLPPTNRTMFLDVPAEELVTADIHSPNVWWRKTSGSTTGTPFAWAIDVRVSVINALAGSLERLERLGFSFEKNKDRDFLFQFNITPKIQTIFNFSAGELHLSKNGTAQNAEIDALMRQINDMGTSIIYTTPSNALFLTRQMERRGLRPRISHFLLTGEPVNVQMHEYITEYFGCEMITLYGAQEAALIGVECGDAIGSYHVLERMYVELLDIQGNPVPEGTEGLVTITPLDSALMPMIRYQPGDMGILHTRRTCSCGNTAPLLEILGRSGDVIRLSETEESSALWLSQLFGKEPFYSKVKRFRIQQTDFGKVTIYIEAKKSLKQSDIDDLHKGIDHTYRGRVHAIIMVVEQLPYEGPKFKSFIPMHSLRA